MNDLISIILPIYKVEKYIDKCVLSVINQTYRNLEIILVDDGSPDRCGEICDEYLKKDSRIKVIHKKNGGLSDARNQGVKIANGKYISFIDPDDYVDNRYIEVLYKNIIETNSDISICNFKEVLENEVIGVSETLNRYVATFDKVEAFNNLYNKKYSVNFVVAWNKLYKKEVWENLQYPKGKIHEDEFLIHELIEKTNRIVYTDDILYYYVQHKNSITGNGYTEKTFDKFEALENRTFFFLNKEYYELYEKALYTLCILNRIIYIETNNKNLRAKLNKQFKKSVKIFFKGNFSIKRKLKILISKCFPIIFKIIKLKSYIKAKGDVSEKNMHNNT